MTAISSPPPGVILLNGFPGVVKYTIAKKLQSKIRAPTALIDNHMLIDPVEATEPGRTPAHYDRRREFRRQEFDKLKRLEGENLAIIMTGCLAATDSDVEQFMEYADIARARGAPLINVNVTCDASENASRFCSAERKENEVD